MAEIVTVRTSIENLTLWQRVYDYLRGEILEGRLEPGSELAEVALAGQLGVSRGPIREALGRLASEGLVAVPSFVRSRRPSSSSCTRCVKRSSGWPCSWRCRA